MCPQSVAKDLSFLHADSEDSDQTGRMPRLVCLHWAHRPFCWFCHAVAHMYNNILAGNNKGADQTARKHKQVFSSHGSYLFAKYCIQRILRECSCIIEFIKQVGGKIRCEAVPSILLISSNEFNEFSNTGAQMQDSIYHVTLKSHFIRDFCIKMSKFRHKKTRHFYGCQHITLPGNMHI